MLTPSCVGVSPFDSISSAAAASSGGRLIGEEVAAASSHRRYDGGGDRYLWQPAWHLFSSGTDLIAPCVGAGSWGIWQRHGRTLGPFPQSAFRPGTCVYRCGAPIHTARSEHLGCNAWPHPLQRPLSAAFARASCGFQVAVTAPRCLKRPDRVRNNATSPTTAKEIDKATVVDSLNRAPTSDGQPSYLTAKRILIP